MTGDAQAVAGLVKVTGQTAANVYGQALDAPDPALTETAPQPSSEKPGARRYDLDAKP